MVRVDAQFDQNELRRLTNALRDMPKECKSGLISAVNKSVKSTNTAMQRGITQRYNIKKSDLSGGNTFQSDDSNNLIKLNLAKKTAIEASIEVRGSRLSLVTARGMITPKQPKSTKGKTMKQIKRIAPPKVKILKGAQKTYKHGFVATGRGGMVGLFTRDSSGKLEMQRTLSIANMVRQREIAEATQRAAREALTRNVSHEIEYRLQRAST